MSGNTFIAWWFSWISKFKIDFRSPCIICKDKPKMLAADGTKIGINVNHSTVVPIEKPTTETSIDPCHRRNERAFIRYSLKDRDSKCKAKSRDHLLYVAKKALGQLEIKDGLSVEEEITRARAGQAFNQNGYRPAGPSAGQARPSWSQNGYGLSGCGV